jgi:hypothetical protein
MLLLICCQFAHNLSFMISARFLLKLRVADQTVFLEPGQLPQAGLDVFQVAYFSP